MFETFGYLYERIATTWKKKALSLKQVYHGQVNRWIG
jgi:hypothetical protein